MATKKITRTITVYEYTTGKFNAASMTVENMQKHSFPYKLGTRDRSALEKKVNGQILGQPVQTEKVYGMSIEDFIRYAKPMDAEEITDDAAE